MAMTDSTEEIASGVRDAIVEALGVDEDEVTPDASLMDQLGAESIDLLDILFRIERKTGVKLKTSDIATYVQGGIPDEEFGDAEGRLSAKGLAHLKKVMPQIERRPDAETVRANQIVTLFSVQNLTDLVASHANGAT